MDFHFFPKAPSEPGSRLGFGVQGLGCGLRPVCSCPITFVGRLRSSCMVPSSLSARIAVYSNSDIKSPRFWFVLFGHLRRCCAAVIVSWVPPGCLLGVSWVSPWCLLGALGDSWLLLGACWVLQIDALGVIFGASGPDFG